MYIKAHIKPSHTFLTYHPLPYFLFVFLYYCIQRSFFWPVFQIPNSLQLLLYQLLLNLYIKFLLLLLCFNIKSFYMFKSTSPLYFYNFLFSKKCFKCSFCFFKLRRMGALWLLSDNSNIWNLVPSSAGSCSCHFETPVNLECLLFTMYSSCPCKSVCVCLWDLILNYLFQRIELSSGRPLGTLLIWVKFFFF